MAWGGASYHLQCFLFMRIQVILPGKNTGMGCHFLLQGIFPTQGSNPRFLWLLHCRWILYPLATRMET